MRREMLGALGACFLALALMVPGLGEPYGGFLAFSEAWYTLVARGYADGSLLLPEVVPGWPDFNLPPLFSWLLHLGFELGGTSETSARLVAIAGALLAVAMTARIGGWTAAALLATSPAFVLVGRNVQPDGWSIGLSLAAYVAWRGRRPNVSGLLFGLALFVKPTVLLLPAALALGETVAQRGLGWIGRVHGGWVALASTPSAVWTALQLSLHREAFLAGLRHGGGALEIPDLALAQTLASEVVFALFPVLLIAAPLAALRHWRTPAVRPAVWVLGVGLASFSLVHYHGYYLVAYAPAAAVIAAALVRGRRTMTLLLLVINAAATQLAVSGHGLGRTAIYQIASQHRGATFLMSPEAWAGYWTVVQLYGDPVAIVHKCVVSDQSGEAIALPAPPGTMADIVGVDRPHGLAILGRTLAQRPANPHRLTWGPLSATRTPGAPTGLVEAGPPIAIGALRVPDGARVCPAGVSP